ncbi:MAG: hypothetical protein CSB06_01240 [Bacteroidia bacterium]|nr:MAG: hypothetical protein CSB06_01240 [Bacteroidia bacterium]
MLPFFLSLLFFCGAISCKEKRSDIPDVYVDIVLDLNDPLYSDLLVPNAYLLITGGVNGILVYHSANDEMYAFERTCPHDPDCGIVEVDEKDMTAVDTQCCQSAFSMLIGGAVSRGPSRFPLKNYRCQYYPELRQVRIRN